MLCDNNTKLHMSTIENNTKQTKATETNVLKLNSHTDPSNKKKKKNLFINQRFYVI